MILFVCYRGLLVGHFSHANSFFILLSWAPTYFHENYPNAKVNRALVIKKKTGKFCTNISLFLHMLMLYNRKHVTYYICTKVKFLIIFIFTGLLWSDISVKIMHFIFCCHGYQLIFMKISQTPRYFSYSTVKGMLNYCYAE